MNETRFEVSGYVSSMHTAHSMHGKSVSISLVLTWILEDFAERQTKTLLVNKFMTHCLGLLAGFAPASELSPWDYLFSFLVTFLSLVGEISEANLKSLHLLHITFLLTLFTGYRRSCLLAILPY